MKLYGSYTSPFVRHCRIALSQGKIAYEFIETDYKMSAELSPVQKVPFLKNGDLTLTDSSSILKYVRELSGKDFFKDLQDFDLFTLTNTLLDSTINLFLLERSGLDLSSVPYLARQSARIQSGLKALDALVKPEESMASDSHIRCACFIDWAIYRDRLKFSAYENLLTLLENAKANPYFKESTPPAS